jgi:hemolysin III
MLVRRFRERDNGVTHLVGALLSLVALGVLVALALQAGSPRLLVAFTVFGLSLVGLYTASTLYHALPLAPRAVARLQRLDHVMIYILIAGSYTPFCLVALRGGWGRGLLGAVWAIAAGGIALKLAWRRAPRWLSPLLYVALGWLALVAAPQFLAAVPLRGLAWVLAGGVIYTLGTAVFALERPRLRPGVFGSHALWHLLVIAGSGCHVWAVARYLTPLG